jgi:hypothetical protein
MDAFEQVISGIFFRDGYWVTQGFKVELTAEEKAKIGRPTSPRWEIDLVVFKGATAELMAVECKSYLDSTGVTANDLIVPNENISRYKLFTDDILRDVVLNRLALQLHDTGLIPAGVKPKLALVAGKMRSADDLARLREHFTNKGWALYDRDWLVGELKQTADESYFDSVAHVVSKLLLRP